MVTPIDRSFIRTVKERCRVCYTCVRECPAKAIRISDGQAEVITERCISCGNCVRVCSQCAKQVVRSVDIVNELLVGPGNVAAIIAPSFGAELDNMDYTVYIGMIRRLGFNYVNEVSFGADLVAREYQKLLLDKNNRNRYISTPCPAVISFVEKYHPDLVPALIPIVSPMVAEARLLRELYGSDIKIVFIGPCIAKKCEAASQNIPNEIDAVLTFEELNQMFLDKPVTKDDVEASDFDEPQAGLGGLFPISRGLLQAANITEDLMVGEVVATDGRTNFVEAVKEFESGDLDARLLEVLACNGCIMGAGMTTHAPLFTRRSRVSRYVRQRMEQFDREKWQAYMDRFEKLDLSRTFSSNDQRIPVPFEDAIAQILVRMGKARPEDHLNCGACGYDTCRDHAVAIFKGLAESEMCLPHTIEKLRRTIDQLASTREALMQSEKLASMGQLAAGIAHEVNNPLGVVLMYSHLLMDEFGDKVEMREDLKMIAEQADRCKKIVSGLLHFARQNKVQLEKNNLLELIDRVIKVANLPANIKLEVHKDIENPYAAIDSDQMIQVLTNLISNAQFAMPKGGVLSLTLTGDEKQVKITVTDTGCGIPEDNIPKLFEPFFTTKKIGVGTGLGLAVTYGIIKMHCGDVQVKSNNDPEKGSTGTSFIITLPRERKVNNNKEIDKAFTAGEK